MEIIFILYKPAVPGNIGAAARAIKTMGFGKLRLIDPCDHLSEEARMLAHGSNDILEKAEVYEYVEKCLEDFDFLIGTTARNRNIKADYQSPSDVYRLILSKGNTVDKVGILFGTEESGLPNEILLQCDLVSTIPLINPYPSLNLGQAVMLYAYALSGLQHKKYKTIFEKDKSYTELKERMEELLPSIGIPAGMPLYNRIMERFALVEIEDINLLHSLTARVKAKLSGKI